MNYAEATLARDKFVDQYRKLLLDLQVSSAAWKRCMIEKDAALDSGNGPRYNEAKISAKTAFNEMNAVRRKLLAAFEEVAAIKFPVDEE